MSHTRWWPKSRHTIRDVTIGDVVHAAFVSGDEERIKEAVELLRETARWWNNTHPAIKEDLEGRIDDLIRDVKANMKKRDSNNV